METLWKFAAIPSVVLTLATWLFFRYTNATENAPLTAAETTFVFAIWFAVTLTFRLIWKKFAKKTEGEASHEAPRP
jgi:hypothetical protein